MVVVALEVKCKNIITGVFYFSTIVQVFNQLPTESSRINVFWIPITSLGVKLMCTFNWLSILWRIYNQLWWKDCPVEWFTFVFNFKIEKLTKRCLFLQWEETQGKRRKKTKTQTRLHQTQLVEQSLGHKKRGTQIYFHTCWQKGGICMVSILVAHVSFGTHLQHTTHQYVLHRINQVFSVSGALTWKTWSVQLDTNSCCCNFGLLHKDESIIWWVPGFRCFISLWVMIQSRNTATKSYPPFFFLLQC